MNPIATIAEIFTAHSESGAVIASQPHIFNLILFKYGGLSHPILNEIGKNFINITSKKDVETYWSWVAIANRAIRDQVGTGVVSWKLSVPSIGTDNYFLPFYYLYKAEKFKLKMYVEYQNYMDKLIDIHKEQNVGGEELESIAHLKWIQLQFEFLGDSFDNHYYETQSFQELWDEAYEMSLYEPLKIDGEYIFEYKHFLEQHQYKCDYCEKCSKNLPKEFMNKTTIPVYTFMARKFQVWKDNHKYKCWFCEYEERHFY